MTSIIAGRLAQQAELEQAVDILQQAGCASDQISAFYLSSAGQHDRFPIGGDRDKSPGAAIGAVLVPLPPPIGVVTGTLVGALGKMKDDGEAEDENPLPVRHAGLMVAVKAPSARIPSRTVDVLLSAGAHDI